MCLCLHICTYVLAPVMCVSVCAMYAVHACMLVLVCVCVLCACNLYVSCVQAVNKYIEQGVAELVPGVLFIDEVRHCCVCVRACVCVCVCPKLSEATYQRWHAKLPRCHAFF